MTVVMVAAFVYQAAGETPVQQFGLLKIANGKLSSASGQPVQLKGMSLFWSQWSRDWYNASAVNNLADQWGCTLVRSAMAVESGGYLTKPDEEKAKIKTVVDAAVAKGIYVIIDWHDHHAEQHLSQSKTFFKEMATAYKNVPNVMFEIYNEPMQVPWKTVKTYAEAVIDEIRNVGAQNVVIVGSPTWSQDVHKAAADPIVKPNVAYSLHFYAGTHKQSLRNQATQAMSKGLAIVVTEFGTCDASGNGGFNEAESETWMKFMDDHQLSWANWSMFDKNETASAMKPGAPPKGPWSAANLTKSGSFVVKHISTKGREFVEGAGSATGSATGSAGISAGAATHEK
ncbi:MAG: glycoside hydrolase family 5 protein [Candidatus Sumerlaeota bacterium]|nr:glycoside hydrolase family 5 protein [Candidatus Sumerlaeota bacterium]